MRIIIICPKFGPEPKFDLVDAKTDEEREMTTEEAAQLVEYDKLKANYDKLAAIVNAWPLNGVYENVIDWRKAPTVIKGGKEYLLFILPESRIDRVDVKAWEGRQETSKAWDTLEDTKMLRGENVTEFGYGFPEAKEK